jgi:hypothetical protein
MVGVLIVRVLGAEAEENVLADPRAFVLPDGKLDFDLLLREFAAFWVGNGITPVRSLRDPPGPHVLTSGAVYHEAAPHLVFMAFLQRVVRTPVRSLRDPPGPPGGGQVEREYGVGRGRIDLLVRWPYRKPAGKRAWQREAIELKVWRPDASNPLAEGLAQLDAYLDRLDLDTGVLVLFDRRPSAAPIAERTRFDKATSPSGRAVTLLRA